MAKHLLSKWHAAHGQHRRDSARRGIGFNLSFQAWYSIWLTSGHLNERGRLKGQYVMARHGDKGPYEIGNVKIILCEENHSEGNLGRPLPKSEDTKRKISAARMGQRLTEETKRKISLRHKGIPKGPMSAETKQKLSLARMGRKMPPLSAEAKLKIGAKKTIYWQNWRIKHGRGAI